MKVAIVGAGDSGKAIKRALQATGAQVTLHSRRTGFDVLRDDGTAALSGADVIVEATGRFTTSKRVATDFFTRSTRAVSAAANALGARHVLLSIVNCDLPEVQGYGYFAGKCAQERLAQDLSKRMSLVRSTQWFEFAEQNMERMRYGPVSLVPSMRMRPVSLDSVAETVAQAALSETDGQTYQVAGPEVMTLWEMTAQLPSLAARPVPLWWFPPAGDSPSVAAHWFPATTSLQRVPPTRSGYKNGAASSQQDQRWRQARSPRWGLRVPRAAGLLPRRLEASGSPAPPGRDGDHRGLPRVRGHFSAAGDLRRRRGRKSCPRTREASPSGTECTRQRAMSPPVIPTRKPQVRRPTTQASPGSR